MANNNRFTIIQRNLFTGQQELIAVETDQFLGYSIKTTQNETSFQQEITAFQQDQIRSILINAFAEIEKVFTENKQDRPHQTKIIYQS